MEGSLARTVVVLGARDGATSGVEPLRTAIHTPRRLPTPT